MMEVKKIYYTAGEVSVLLGISIGTSYRIIKYFEEKYYGLRA